VTRELELRHGPHRVVVVSRGAGIREWPGVLAGYPAGEQPPKGHGQVLMPWPNRIVDGRYEWEGETFELPLNEPPYAIHGFVRDVEWDVVGHGAFEYALDGRPGYPFSLRLRVEYALDDDGLAVRTLAENVGDRAAPFGAGHHPYLAGAAGGEQLDETRRWDGRHLSVWADDAWPYVQLFAWHGDLAVEPMTCPPNAFQTGESVIRLEPGDVFEGRWGIRGGAVA
jgi:aldose 1-epimerase